MKKILLFVLLLLAFKLVTYAQTEKIVVSQQHKRTCATMMAIEKSRKEHPEYYAELEKRAKEFERTNTVARTATLTSPVYIPIVVHVVYSNPNLVTEEQVDYLIDRLNKDYSGLNSDSSNASYFYGVRGHSNIRFVRARRDPNGNLTNGIERKVSTSIGILATTYQKVKHSSDGGLDPWDVTKYYNIWVADDASGQGILGIAPSIGPGAATETSTSTVGIDGVCINVASFADGCFSDPSYNLARTAVHEIGHNFGLYHTFSGCTTGADFTQLDSGQFLPTNLLTASDDTPNQGTETSGAPTGNVLSDCGSVYKMYQNYMDYSNDISLTLFTKGQVARMEYVLENFRSGYLTTNGGTPPATTPTLDVAVSSILSPGSSLFNNSTCTITNYPNPICPGNFVPKLIIKNLGTTTITSVTASISVNGNVSTQNFTGLNIASTKEGILNFATNSNLIAGSNTILYTLSAPNGGVDAVSSNNTISQTLTIAYSPSSAPLTDGFESTTFPSAGWSLQASAASKNWFRTTSAYKTGIASIVANFYNITSGEDFSLVSSPITLPYNATSTLTFDYAYNLYSDANGTVYGDSLYIMASTDCGNTWTTLWKKGGNTLKTTTSAATSSSFVPTAAQWATTPASISLNSYLNQAIQLRFRAVSDYGNNLFVDNIAVTGTSYVPLNFISFTGFATAENNIQLNWKTANEVNCQSFVVEKSTDAINFKEIGSLDAKNGKENYYSLLDLKSTVEKNYYRIKQVDKDGKITYSNTILVSLKKLLINSISLFPNPVKDKLTLNINAATKNQASIKIIDATGRVVLKQNADLVVGNQSISLNASNLSAGIYTITVNFGEETISQKLIKD